MDYNHVTIRNLRKIEGAAVRKCYNIALSNGLLDIPLRYIVEPLNE